MIYLVGIDKVNTLQKRWSTLKKAQALGNGFDATGAVNGAASGDGDGPAKKAAPKKRAKPKAADGESPKKKAKAAPKKAAKSKEVVEEDEDDDQGEGEGEGEEDEA
jgi:hypothetical protein